jgi:thymidylate kinase
MFVLVNGSFGIGKTTTSKALVKALPNATIFDPEDVGYVLHRLPPILMGRLRKADDYQDLWLWRWLIGIGGRHAHGGRDFVVVPMAFTNLRYLDGFAAALEKRAPVRRFCLVAPLELVRARLAQRATRQNREMTAWELRRSAECVAAHADPAFGEPIDAAQSPEAIVADIVSRVT